MKKKSSRTFGIMLAILLSALTLRTTDASMVSLVKGNTQTIVKLDPSRSQANVSAIFTINITIVDVQNLYAVEVTLNWNSSVLMVTNIDIRLGQADGVLHGSPFIAQNMTRLGRYSLAATSVGPAPPFYGNGTVVSITFEVINLGSSPLSLESQLSDYSYPNPSSPIDHSTLSGAFDTTIPEFPNVVFAILFVALSMFIVVLSWTLQKNRRSYSRQMNRRQPNEYSTACTNSTKRSAR